MAKKNVTHDPEMAKEFVNKWFLLENEIKGLMEERKILKDDYSDKVNMKLVSAVIAYVRAESKLPNTPDAVQKMSEIVKNKIGMVS
jgi:hypothetical protein